MLKKCSKNIQTIQKVCKTIGKCSKNVEITSECPENVRISLKKESVFIDDSKSLKFMGFHKKFAECSKNIRRTLDDSKSS